MAKVKRLDPTKTTLLRRRFVREMSKRFRELQTDVMQLVYREDAFGLEDELFPNSRKKASTFKKRLGVQARRQFVFATDDRKITEFHRWLDTRVQQGLLTTDPVSGKPWLSEYVDSAYQRGVLNAYTSTTKKPSMLTKPEFYEGTRAEFLRASFGAPETTAKLRLLYTRAFDQLDGITRQMSGALSTVLTDGFTNGWGALKMAREINKTIGSFDRVRSRRLARTEIIYAHAEGQLDSFDRLGVEEVGIQAEWLTAGDALVCPRCGAMEGHVYKVSEAHGLIPLHPNCRCSWIPYVPHSG